MWEKICSLILRKRLPILLIIGLITVFMGYKGSSVEMSYEFAKLLPANDTAVLEYEQFKKQFGEDGNILVIGIQEKDLFQLEKFRTWYELGNKIKEMDGVDEVISVAHIYNLHKNDSIKKFDFKPVVARSPQTQEEVDSLKKIIFSLPFYKSKLYNDSTDASLLAITLDSKIINSKARDKFILNIKKTIEDFIKDKNIKVHYSGLPFIRTNMTTKVAAELKFFTLLAVLVTAFILLLFFRSFYIMLFSILVVAVGVTWSLGTIALMGYKISILLGLIPPLIIVVGIPNCIFLINKYHQEYKKHGNQAKSLIRIIQKIGFATFMTNATTAVGFATFIITNNRMLQEFGVIASINIMFVFLLSLLLIPPIFSYLSPPKIRHIKHLENKFIQGLIEKFILIITHHRKSVYLTATAIVLICIYGITKMKTTGNIVDDIPRHDPVYTDLKFFENNFGGVMPFEVAVDYGKDGAATQLNSLRQIEELQTVISSYPEFSRSLSIADAVKFSKQAFYNGSAVKYGLPNDLEKSFLAPYFKNKAGKRDTLLKAFVDSSKRITRISAQMQDIGTNQMQRILNDIKPRIDSIFNPEEYKVTITGNSLVFLKGTTYLVNNLMSSLAFAIVIISLMMASLFSSWRMVIVSLIPNFIPLFVTAGLMGYCGIAIKPSTILVFSIAFGISVDDTIHYLAKYRQELRLNNWNIKDSVIISLRESGLSMIYTSVILFFGFGIFSLSNFGGTVALGILISITLLVAMFSNLIVLPSLLLSLEKIITNKAFKEPYLQLIDEE